ncbi:hypothetical protein K490DRAFT_63223 [Saccharata proteae CBS 121410]|uniref:Sde2 N-terminal ubiquitin domain-containing protein n=1 Tax=Saccharata proteae CBS 121410 TaxID=1314787 RepID=A0A9P4HYU4_9PEZI|nr:hypothetical protein K490DRAFT_63223 [Saccharata proteae CBS 121410]
MAPQMINVLLTSFPGLGLPTTLSLPLPASSTVSDFTEALSQRIPAINNRLLLTTTSNKLLQLQSETPLASLLSSPDDAFLPLRLSAPLCGGKGGFGSQLRAAGGRMRKKRGQGENHGSSRNLDGRRLRTVNEAKALADLYAIKPEMDRKEKEERRKRWEQFLESTEKKEQDLQSGGGHRARLDGKWVEAKEEAIEKTRESIMAAMEAGDISAGLGDKESDKSGSGSGVSEGSESDEEVVTASASKPAVKTFFGWDEDEDMSDDDDEDEPAEKAF